MDTVNGQKKQTAIEKQAKKLASQPETTPKSYRLAYKAFTGHTPFPSLDIPKPQIHFADTVDNSLSRPLFDHKLADKTHAMVPADYVYPQKFDMHGFSAESKRHPYFYETVHLGYPTSMFTVSTPIQPVPLEDQEVIVVDDNVSYRTMVDELKGAEEIAIDLEHHDTRSYYGFTCLLQISTRDKDWVVDAIKLRSLLAQDKLGGVMADPSVIKVSSAFSPTFCPFSDLVVRSFMALTWISSGSRKIFKYTSSICSILTMHRSYWVSATHAAAILRRR